MIRGCATVAACALVAGTVRRARTGSALNSAALNRRFFICLPFRLYGGQVAFKIADRCARRSAFWTRLDTVGNARRPIVREDRLDFMGGVCGSVWEAQQWWRRRRVRPLNSCPT